MRAPAFRSRRAAFVSAIMLSSCAFPAYAQDAADAEDDDEVIVVTGYRASLESSANAKRDSVGFTDTVFAEDIGKFPDTNIAESLNRIPGVTITREISGDGLNVAIRGLGTNFTRVLLNDAPIAIASTGRTDSQNTNREVDLDLFPTELFTQLTVSKSPTARMIEGGAAGIVNMRSARPFDNEGFHINYSAAATKGSVGLAQYFATGVAAQILAATGGAAVVAVGQAAEESARSPTKAAAAASIVGEVVTPADAGPTFDAAWGKLLLDVGATDDAVERVGKVRAATARAGVLPGASGRIATACNTSKDACVSELNSASALFNTPGFVSPN